MEKETDEEEVGIGAVYETICLLEKDEILYDVNEEKLELMKNEMSSNVLEDVTHFDSSCKEGGGAEVIHDFITELARLKAWIAMATACSTKWESREGHGQKLPSDTYRK